MNKDDLTIEELEGGTLRIFVDHKETDTLAIIDVAHAYDLLTVRTALRGNFDVKHRPVQRGSHSIRARTIDPSEREARRVEAYRSAGLEPPQRSKQPPETAPDPEALSPQPQGGTGIKPGDFSYLAGRTSQIWRCTVCNQTWELDAPPASPGCALTKRLSVRLPDGG